jgi:hypothetical protein
MIPPSLLIFFIVGFDAPCSISDFLSQCPPGSYGKISAAAYPFFPEETNAVEGEETPLRQAQDEAKGSRHKYAVRMAGKVTRFVAS